MHMESVLFQAFIYLVAAVLSVPVAKFLGLGSVLGYLIAGSIIGPSVLGLVGKEGQDVMHFAEFGVVMMLFLVGLELQPSKLWKMRMAIFGIGSAQVILTSVVMGGLAYVWLGSFSVALTLGLILSLSSTAIVLQSLAEKGWLKSKGGDLSFSVLLFQDIAVIPILALMPLLVTKASESLKVSSVPGAGNNGHQAASNSVDSGIFNNPKIVQLLLTIVVITGIVVIGKYLSRWVFRLIAKTGLREIFTATSLLLVIGIAVAMHYVGLSAALGTFLAGVVLAESEYRHELESAIEPFKGLLLGLFFISVGASIQFGFIGSNPMLIFSLTSIFLIVKFFILLGIGKIFKLPADQNLLFSLALAQGGEFAFVLISFALQLTLFDTHIANISLIVVALSMVATPLVLLVYEKLLVPKFTGKNSRDTDVIEDHAHPVILAGLGRFGVVVCRILQSNGFACTILDNNPDQVDVLRKFGFKVFYGDATRPDLLELAGIDHAKALVIAIDDRDKITELSKYIHHKYPHLKLYVRSIDGQHSYELMRAGVKNIQQETTKSAISLGVKVLAGLGFEKFQAYRAGKIFSHHNQRIMKNLYETWSNDSKLYVQEAKNQALELEKILTEEKNSSIHDSDEAWDTSTLREEIRQMVQGAKLG